MIYLLVFAAGSFYLVRLMGRDPDDPKLEPMRKGPLRTGGSGRIPLVDRLARSSE